MEGLFLGVGEANHEWPLMAMNWIFWPPPKLLKFLLTPESTTYPARRLVPPWPDSRCQSAKVALGSQLSWIVDLPSTIVEPRSASSEPGRPGRPWFSKLDRRPPFNDSRAQIGEHRARSPRSLRSQLGEVVHSKHAESSPGAHLLKAADSNLWLCDLQLAFCIAFLFPFCNPFVAIKSKPVAGEAFRPQRAKSGIAVLHGSCLSVPFLVAEEVAETPVRQTLVSQTPARHPPLQQSPATAPLPLHQAQSAAPLRPQVGEFAPLIDFFREAARGTPARRLDFVDRQSAEPAELRPPVLPSPDSETPSPFVDRIRWESAPSNFREPRLPFYSGETDPVSHLQAFEGAVALRSLSDALKCKLLVTTLEGQAREWFYELPSGTISSFTELRSELLLRFATSKKRKDGPAALFDIKQRDNESVERFVDRFQKEIQGVRNVNPDYYKVALIHGLREGPLKFKVTAKAPSTYQELIAMANRFIEGENANPTYISSLTAKAGGRDASSFSNNQYHSKPPRPDFQPPSQRGRNLRHKKPFLGHQQFHGQRLPLAATPAVPLQALPIPQSALPAPDPYESSPMKELANLGLDFEEVVQIIQRKAEEKRQGPQRDWKPRDNSQFCNFHKEKGHLTKDCKALQKIVKRLLVEGKIEGLGRKSDSSKPSTSKGKEVAEVQQECIEIRDEGHLGLVDIPSECIDVVERRSLGKTLFHPWRSKG
ncbi:hypothetical protein KSP39_PZI012693 [Platanthera zijinensis]|uniref:Retrotransposon gag domain-containing protein n=1 Tax=Platanthera zijinensis TaxID=2320716 RepID=A0AAP0BEJ8_9ASPA